MDDGFSLCDRKAASLLPNSNSVGLNGYRKWMDGIRPKKYVMSDFNRKDEAK